ncbi:MAG: retroviral-like aspartic protease family protein [Treponema sp.]|nr:retroviral-like aspartic protease family protein [Candidatus Treponema equi]
MKQFKAFTIESNSGIMLALKTPVTVTSIISKNAADVVATWDTGASRSCISKRIVEYLNLKPVGLNTYNTAAGSVECYEYVINVILPNSVCCRQILVSEFSGAENTDMLVGMDIICLGDMAITNANGITMMSFRIPPANEHTNYLE